MEGFLLKTDTLLSFQRFDQSIMDVLLHTNAEVGGKKMLENSEIIRLFMKKGLLMTVIEIVMKVRKKYITLHITV